MNDDILNRLHRLAEYPPSTYVEEIAHDAIAEIKRLKGCHGHSKQAPLVSLLKRIWKAARAALASCCDAMKRITILR